MANVVLCYERSDRGDSLSVVNSNKFKKNPRRPHIYFDFHARDQIYSFERKIPQQSFTSDLCRINEPSHLTDRAGSSHNFEFTRGETSQNQMRYGETIPNSGLSDSSRSTSTTYDRIQVNIAENSIESKNLKSSRCSLGRGFCVLVVLFILAIGGAMIYLFYIKKDSQGGIAEYNVPVAFEKSSYVFKIGYNATLACHFENIQEWRSIDIGFEGGKIVAINATELPMLRRSNIVKTESFLTNNSGRIVVIFDPVQCNDSPEATVGDFECTCAVRTDEDTLEARTVVTFQSNPGKPVLTMSREKDENKSSLIDILFTCEGELGYPTATLEIQSNFSGTFETLLSPKTGFMNKSLALIVSDEPEKSECKNYRKIEFAFYKITIDMQYKHLRCVMQPTDGKKEATYDEKPIYVQDIACDDLTGTIGRISEVKCTFYNIEIDFDNLTKSPVTVLVDDNGTSIFNSSRNSLNESYSFVTLKDVEISFETTSVFLKFTPLRCMHVGEYTIKYSALQGSSRVDITANILTPVISRPDKFYRNQNAVFTCTGDMGRPKGELALEVYQEDGAWHDVSDITRIESETENCTTVTTITHTFYVNVGVNGYQYRCQSRGDSDEVLSSGIEEVVISDAVYFTETSVSRKIGSTFEFTCVLEATFSSSGAIISRNSGLGGAETLCNISDTGLVTCSFARISGIAWTSENNLTTTLTMFSVNCEDEGLFFCGSVSHNSLQASMILSVTKLPNGKPELSIPARMVVDLKEYYNKITCTANVGYPAGDLQIQYSNDNFVTYKKLDIGIADVATSGKEGCSVTKIITYRQYRYTQSWNNTEIRCVVYYPSGEATSSIISEIQVITLIKNECPPVGDWYYYHPINCHYHITCSEGHITVVDHCGNNCPDVRNNRSAPLCTGDCSRC